jgi:tRNA(Ile)-lysidine synthase
VFAAEKFARLPAEVALRLLGRAIDHAGDEGPVELGKLEALHAALQAALAGASTTDTSRKSRLRRTLGGALVTLAGDALLIERAPPRRHGAAKSGRRATSRR